MITATLLLAGVALELPPRLRIVILALGAGLVGSPLFAIAVGVLAGGAVGRRVVRRRTEAGRRLPRDVGMLAELTALGLSGGLGPHLALELAAEAVGGPVGREARGLLRRMHVDGSAVAAAATGHAAALYRLIGRGLAGGAALTDSVTRLADDMAAEQAAEELRRVRRLPVVLLFPLTLLILPGFLLLTVAPALLDAFGRLQI